MYVRYTLGPFATSKYKQILRTNTTQKLYGDRSVRG